MTQPVLPLLPAKARSIGPSAGLLEGLDGGGAVLVFGLVTFNYVAGDDAGRRLAAVQPGHGVGWAGAFTEGGCSRWCGNGPVRGGQASSPRRWPRGSSRWTPAV